MFANEPILRVTAPIAEAQLVYAPDDPQYEEIKHHLGGIKPGESKPVPPWCGLNSEP